MFLLVFPLFARPLHFSAENCSQYSNQKWLWATPSSAIFISHILSKKVIFDRLMNIASHASSSEQAAVFITSMTWRSNIVCWSVDGSLIVLITVLSVLSFYKHRIFYLFIKKLNFDVESIKLKHFMVRSSSFLLIISIFSYVVYIVESTSDGKYISYFSENFNESYILYILLVLAGLHFWATQNSNKGMRSVYKGCYL